MLDEVPSLWQVLAARIEEAVRDLGAYLFTLRPAEHSVGFSIALIALCAKLAKADGHVTIDEVRAFRSILEIPPHEEANAARVFNLCRQDMTGYEIYARQLVRILGEGEASEARRLDVLDALFHIAVADGEYHPDEARFLQTVATIFACPPEAFSALQARHVPESWDPWTVLGLRPGATLDEVRAARRRLVRENHPDHMIARGAPIEMVKLANQRVVDLNRAQDEIVRHFAPQHEKADIFTPSRGGSHT